MMEKYDLPERERRRRNLWPFLLLIVVLLLAGGGLFAWLMVARQPAQPSLVSTNPHFSATAQSSTTTGQSPASAKGTPPAVANDVRQRVAQRLHLSVDQLTAKLQSSIAIDSLAAQQGMSSDAWRTFVLATYQAAYEKEVRAGNVAQARADHDMRNIRSYPLDALNSWVTSDCLGVTPD
jgi:hypothetical protein